VLVAAPDSEGLGVTRREEARDIVTREAVERERLFKSGSGLDGAEVTLVCRKASLSTSGGRKVLVRGIISSHAKTTNLGSRVIPAQPIVH
jgi:hypothetical protein